MADYTIKINDPLKIQTVIKSKTTKAVIDMSAGSIAFDYFKPSNQTFTADGTWSGTVTDGVNGVCEYDIPANTLDEMNDWRIESRPTIDGNTYTSDTQTIKVIQRGR